MSRLPAADAARGAWSGDIMQFKSFLVSSVVTAALMASGSSAHASIFEITYIGLGTSGTAFVTGTAVGGGEYDLTSGTLQSSTLGTETLVALDGR
jgi:hypothetical protein